MNGFLDTEGNLHECEYWEHLDKAFTIVKNMGVFVANKLEAEEYLLKLGWIVIRTKNVYGLYHITQKQKSWLNKAYEYMTDECRESVDMLFDMDK